MSKFSVKKSITIFMAVIAVIILGIVSYTRMTPDLLPSMDLPYIVVVTTYPGASPESVELEVTKPLEQSLGTLENLKTISSSSAENVSMIMLEFEDDTNMDARTVDIIQQTNLLEGTWDDMIGTPMIMSINPNIIPVAIAAVNYEGKNTEELSEFMDNTLISELEGTPGIASVSTTGGVESQIDVVLSQEKIDALNEEINGIIVEQYMAAMAAQSGMDLSQMDLSQMDMPEAPATASATDASGVDMSGTDMSQLDISTIITPEMLEGILFANNFSMPAGYVRNGDTSWAVTVGDEIENMDELNDLVILDLGMDGVEPIKLGDVANVVITDNSGEIYAKLNSADAVMLTFSKQSSYATATAAKNVEEKFDELSEQYDGLNFTFLMNQGDYIDIIMDSITSSLLWGALFAVIILFLFLKDLRPTFITLCSIPVSLLFALILMYFSGITLNMMSLSGLAIAVGMLVDNSVVVIENVFRLRNEGYNIVKASIYGAKQVGGAIAASTLTTICVFLPIVFVDGLTKTLFVDFALTLAYALIASLIIALTFVPALASKILKKESKKESKLFKGMVKGYRASLKWALSHKIVVTLVVVVLLIGSFALELSKGFVFMPETDMPQLSGSIEFEPGTSFGEMTEVADETMEKLLTVDGVTDVGIMISSGDASTAMMTGSSGNTVGLYILLDEAMERSVKDICDDMTGLCEDMEGEFSVASSMDMSAMTGGSGISVSVYSEDMEKLQKAADDIAAVLEDTEGAIDVSNGMEENDPALRITVDKEEAIKYGLTVAGVYSSVSEYIADNTSATDILFDSSSYDVYVSSDSDQGVTVDEIKEFELEVTGTDGAVSYINLSDIATVEESETLNSISRDNQRRYLTVSAVVEDGYNVTKVTDEFKDKMKDYKAEDGVTYSIGGEDETIMESMKDLMLMMLLGIILVYMVMAAQFQSFKSPFIIMFTIPLAFTGGMLALLIANMEVSIISIIGFVMLCGIIVNNGIVLVDYINQLRAGGMNRQEAIIEAGATRLRPILMTALTTILGLIVMALGVETGSEMMQPIAIVCIGGLVYATLLTLYFIPCIYYIFNKKELKILSEEDTELIKD